ncbi:hypothetical protein J7T55_009384 [Diaporthe amygdali]|uniref:uncharacterized protein n=1 Tax=Phomopsis amygdali TaxID=1214568 RepID=UPI0022FED11A|nr:uncharacterized protein J7T55_009384 [Diaporthe amygdali]KAJ0107419.1 hypothetical protein J7T55_009384 [Diaporthe amygdali]
MAMQTPMYDLLQSFQVWSDLDEANPGLVNVGESPRPSHSGDGTHLDASSETMQPKSRTGNGSIALLQILLPASKQKAQ